MAKEVHGVRSSTDLESHALRSHPRRKQSHVDLPYNFREEPELEMQKKFS